MGAPASPPDRSVDLRPGRAYRSAVTASTAQALARMRAIGLGFPRAVLKGGVASGVGALSGTRVVTFTVSRRIFARVFVLDGPDGGERIVLWLRADPAERASLLAAGHPYFAAGPREVGVVLDDDTDWSEIRELVTESYVLMAPKSLAGSVLRPDRVGRARAADGVEIAYEVHGDDAVAALTVVLVHGWAGNRSYWSPSIGRLRDRHRVVTVDLGGHGESGLGRGDWNLPSFGEDVVAVVEEVASAPVVLVGHSMGGDAVVYAAQRLGSRGGGVVGIVWVDAFRSLGHEPASTAKARDAFLAPFRDDFPGAVDRFARSLFPPTADAALVDRVAADMAGAPRDVALGSLRYALGREPGLLAAMADIEAPIVAINPDLAPTDVDSLAQHGVARTILLEGVGHFPMLEDPDRFNPVLEDVLGSFGP
jgi:pimeloyl-ACP methyl ester carboxylesterase